MENLNTSKNSHQKENTIVERKVVYMSVDRSYNPCSGLACLVVSTPTERVQSSKSDKSYSRNSFRFSLRMKYVVSVSSMYWWRWDLVAIFSMDLLFDVGIIQLYI